MAKWELVLLVCCLHRSLSEYTLMEASNYAEARMMCNNMGGKLPLPTDDDENAELAAYMMRTGLNKTWLDAKLIRSPWHTSSANTGGNITFGYDQGCHSLPPQADSPEWFFTAKSCIQRCNGRFDMFVAIRVSRYFGWRCECFNSTRFLPMLPEQSCSITCPYLYGCGVYWNDEHHVRHAYRVLPTSHVDVTWTRQWRDATVYDLQEALCTSVHDDEDDAYQQQEYCYSFHPSICCTESGAKMLSPLTWFEADFKCWSEGGFIVSPGDSCWAASAMHNENEGNMWSDLRAWMWEIGGRAGEEHIYTKWSHTEPRFTRGECVVLTAEHLWETAICTQPSNFACVTESDETTIGIADITASMDVSTIASTLSSDNNTSAQEISSTSRTIGIAVGVAVAVVLVIAVAVIITICFKRRRSKPPTNTPNHHTNATYFSEEDDVTIGDRIKHERQGDGKVNEFVDIKDNSVYVSSDASDYTELRKDTHDDRHYEVVRGVDGAEDGTLVVENELYTEKDPADPEQ